MPANNLAISFTLGAALGGSFVSTLGRATRDIGELGKQIKGLEGLQSKFGKLDDLESQRGPMQDAVLKLEKEREAAQRAKIAADRAAKKGGDAELKAAIEADVALQKTTERLRAKNAEYRKLTARVDRLTAATANADRRTLSGALDLLAAEKRLGEAKAETKNAMEELGGTVKRAWNWFTIGTAASIGAVIALGKSVSNTADEVGGLAQRLGMTTQSLQEMQYAGTQNNIEVAEMNDQLGKLQIRLNDAANGSGDAAVALRRLGLDAFALSTMAPDEAINEISRALQRVKNPGDRAALAVQLLGKEGAKMANLLSAAPEELARLRDEARRTGFVMDSGLVASGQRFDAGLKKLGATLIGVRNIFGAAFLPALTEAADALGRMLVDNGDAFRSLAVDLGRVIGSLIPDLVMMAKAGLQIALVFAKLFGVLSGVLSATHSWGLVLGVIAGVTIVAAIGKVMALRSALAGLWAQSILFNRLNGGGGIAGFLGGLTKPGGLVFRANRTGSLIALGFQGGLKTGMQGAWRTLFGGMATGALARFGSALTPVITVLKTLIGWLAPVWGWVVAIGAIFASVFVGIRKHWDGIVAAFKPGIDAIRDAFSWLFKSADGKGSGLMKFLTMLWTFLRVIGEAAGLLLRLVGHAFSALVTGVTSFGDRFPMLGRLLKYSFAPVLVVIDAIMWAVDELGGVFDWITGKLEFLFNAADFGVKAFGFMVGDGKAFASSPAGGGSRAALDVPQTASQMRATAASDAPVSITVHASPGQSEDAIARKVADLVETRNRRATADSYR